MIGLDFQGSSKGLGRLLHDALLVQGRAQGEMIGRHSRLKCRRLAIGIDRLLQPRGFRQQQPGAVMGLGIIRLDRQGMPPGFDGLIELALAAERIKA